jgi:hypothetical protein
MRQKMNFVQQLLLLAPLALGDFDPTQATSSDAASHKSTPGSVVDVSGEIGVEEAEAMQPAAANYPLTLAFETAGPARPFAVLNSR